MKGLETAIVKALKEAGQADAQTRAKIYQSARDALGRAISKQQLDGSDAAIEQHRKLEKIINSVEAEYQKAQMRKHEPEPEPDIFDLEPEELLMPETVLDPDDLVLPEEREPRRSRPASRDDDLMEPAPFTTVDLDFDRPEPKPRSEAPAARGGRAEQDMRAEPELRADRDARSRAEAPAPQAPRPDRPNRRRESEAPPRRNADGPARRPRAPVRKETQDPEFEDVFVQNERQTPRRSSGAQPQSVRPDWPEYDDIDWQDPGDRRQKGPRRPKTPAAEEPQWEGLDAAPEPVLRHDQQDWDAADAPRPVHRNGKRQRNRPDPQAGQTGRPPRARKRMRQDPPPPRASGHQPNRPVRWEEPEVDAGRGGRRSAGRNGKKRRFPIFSLVLVLALAVAFVGIGVWWFIVGGLGLSSEERDMSVPNPPAQVESEDFAGSPRPQGRFSDDWVRVFSPDDITNVSANDDASVELLDEGSRAALQITSANADEAGEVSFELGPGVLQMMQDRESLVAITLRSASEEPTQIYIRCDFPGLGDCGRRRFDVAYELNDIIFNVDLRGAAATGLPGYIYINPDVTGASRSIDIYGIRIRPE
ncbi:hypothetical protein K1W69_11160 [Hoeflea sp. WL0058]|uniref:Uncharacterized protein n=1 Tax=Flavimaribacter sediminis TaxID=2865987 RepID=A0AAE3D1B5_9HYPH|nr:hypothetical protein [Flavimaribacter sediminis]MBW8637747.1 hypothetical protein [Flavimaribacter sediminis]